MQNRTTERVNHRRYAGTVEQSPYDLMAMHNHEYRAIVRQVEHQFVSRLAQRPDIVQIADLGCGTGNFTRAIVEHLPQIPKRTIVAVDITEAMLDIARAKSMTWRSGHAIELRQGDLLEPDLFCEATFDAINTVHALNLTREPQTVIRHIAKWLKPGGLFCAVDIGRPLRLTNWARGVIKWVYGDNRRAGSTPTAAAFRTASYMVRTRHAASQNRLFEAAQREGHYPMHSPEEFIAWFKQVGLVVDTAQQMYVDPTSGVPISDFVIGHKAG